MSILKRTYNAFKVIAGFISIFLGLGIYLWASEHSPNMRFIEMMTKMDSYTIKQPAYNIILIISALFAINGILLIVFALIAEKKKD